MNFWKLIIFTILSIIILGGIVYAWYIGANSGFFAYIKCLISPSSQCAYQAARLGGNEKFCLYVDEKVEGYGSFGTTFNRGDCYFAVARKKGDISLCEFIEGTRITIEPQKDYCISLIATDKKDGVLCNEIEDLSMRNSCYYDIGWRTKNTSLCDKIIEDKNRKDSCYREIAVTESNSSLCEKVESVSYRDECFKSVAVYAGNSSLCNKISEDKKEACFTEVEDFGRRYK